MLRLAKQEEKRVPEDMAFPPQACSDPKQGFYAGEEMLVILRMVRCFGSVGPTVPLDSEWQHVFSTVHSWAGKACIVEHLVRSHSYDQSLAGLNLGCISGNSGSTGNKITRKHKILRGPS